MSLQVDEGGRRGRSRSPSGRRRDDDRDRSRGRAPVDEVPYPDPSDAYRSGDADAAYEYERLAGAHVRTASPSGNNGSYARGSNERVSESASVRFSDGRREVDYRYEKERDRDRPRDSDHERERDIEKHRNSLQYLPQKYAPKVSAEDAESPRYSRESLARDRDRDREREREKDRDSDRERERERQKARERFEERERDRDRDRDRDREKEREKDRDYGRDRDRDRDRRDHDDDLAYGSGPIAPVGKPAPRPRGESPPSTYQYAETKQYEYTKEYSKPSENVTYATAEPRRGTQYDSLDPRQSNSSVRAPSPGPQRRESTRKYQKDSYLDDPRGGVVTVEPGEGPRRPSRRDASPGPLRSAMKRDVSPLPPTARMSSLSVQTTHATGLSLAAAPGSPLLESYTGTYQSMSPMPSPLLLPSHGGADLVETVSPVRSDDERGDKKRSRRARFHDPVDDAARLAKALKGEKRAPEIEPLIEILPGLTQEEVMDLRVEYKRLVKTGSDRKGVNIAKHIRARLKDEDPLLMKACYATALGQWESEAYWANFWYQGDKTRREMLIEALMGRSNDEIREIKAGFSDKKYSNSLTKCMKTELKEDKFKKAVLMVLEEQRMDEFDAYGRPLRIDPDLVRNDVRDLHHAVKSEKGGETLMITIVVQRSDTHLREVLKRYSEHYQSNLAKDALKKSGNLVVSQSRVASRACEHVEAER